MDISFRNCAVCEMMRKNMRAGQATNDNMAHGHYLLDTEG
jgi:hypothetical protein